MVNLVIIHKSRKPSIPAGYSPDTVEYVAICPYSSVVQEMAAKLDEYRGKDISFVVGESMFPETRAAAMLLSENKSVRIGRIQENKTFNTLLEGFDSEKSVDTLVDMVEKIKSISSVKKELIREEMISEFMATPLPQINDTRIITAKPSDFVWKRINANQMRISLLNSIQTRIGSDVCPVMKNKMTAQMESVLKTCVVRMADFNDASSVKRETYVKIQEHVKRSVVSTLKEMNLNQMFVYAGAF